MGLFDSNLVIRDLATGEARSFDRTSAGYAAARSYQESILERGHEVGDDGLGSLSALEDQLGAPKTGSHGGLFSAFWR